MEHKGTKVIETARLVLRPFRMEDAADMYRNWASDPEVTRFLTWQPHADLGVTQKYLTMVTENYSDPRHYEWALELKALGQVIGALSIVRMDEEIGAVELGYCMGRTWWGQTLMPEAVQGILPYLFREVGANRVAARHAVGNPKSGRVMQKAGMTYEGTLRQAARSNQGLEDLCVYSILAREFSEV